MFGFCGTNFPLIIRPLYSRLEDLELGEGCFLFDSISALHLHFMLYKLGVKLNSYLDAIGDR
jgi:hypothetical protein